MTHNAKLDALIPHFAPTDRVARALLLAIRRLAVGGLSDANAANILIGEFGIAYRRPLMFLRVLVAEVSRIAEHKIHIAPTCCTRMTQGEAAFLTVIERSRADPAPARAALAHMTGSLDCLPALSVAKALADVLDDIGRHSPWRKSRTFRCDFCVTFGTQQPIPKND
jgi:hypothetical protein